jgi:hypothetical protein
LRGVIVGGNAVEQAVEAALRRVLGQLATPSEDAGAQQFPRTFIACDEFGRELREQMLVLERLLSSIFVGDRFSLTGGSRQELGASISMMSSDRLGASLGGLLLVDAVFRAFRESVVTNMRAAALEPREVTHALDRLASVCSSLETFFLSPFVLNALDIVVDFNREYAAELGGPSGRRDRSFVELCRGLARECFDAIRIDLETLSKRRRQGEHR